jgi:large subunit ribosomal protein L31e
MAEKDSKKIEREYVIPLREKSRVVPRYKKTPKAVKTIKEFVARHMKIENRDLNKVRIDLHLNEQLWMRGIKKHPHKVKVKVVKEGDIVRVYGTDLPEKINFKKARLEKKDKAAKETAEKLKESQKSMMEKAKDQMKTKSKDEKAEEVIEKEEEKSGVSKEVAKKEAELDVKETKKVGQKEKAEALEETAQKEAKETAKAEKKTTKEKTSEAKGKEKETKQN